MIRNLYTGEVQRGRCVRCHAHSDEPAADGCRNPAWHVPKPDMPRDPEQQTDVRLPYAED